MFSTTCVYQRDLFSPTSSKVRFRRYTAAWSPPTFTQTVWLFRHKRPIPDKAYVQKRRQLLLVELVLKLMIKVA